MGLMWVYSGYWLLSALWGMMLHVCCICCIGICLLMALACVVLGIRADSEPNPKG